MEDQTGLRMIQVQSPSDQALELKTHYGNVIAASKGAVALLDLTRDGLRTLLRRTSDTPHREKTLTAVTRYFEAVLETPALLPSDKLVKLKIFSLEIITMVIDERPLIAERAKAAEALTAQTAARRLADTNPEALSGKEPQRMTEIGKLAETEIGDQIANIGMTEATERILQPANDRFEGANDLTSITIVKPQTPYVCTGFADLFPEAMGYKIERVTSFFQRHNPTVTRQLAKPFLLAPEFGERLVDVVKTIIAPEMRSKSRNISIIENSRSWSGATVEDFWQGINANERFFKPIKAGWDSTWELCRQKPVVKPGINGKTVLLADPMLKVIRSKLAPIEDEYSLPILRNPEIDLLTALAFEFDPVQMELLWNRLRQIYEQELDTRVYQDKARDGALRDSLLQTFSMLPDAVGDFMVILSYFCFPNIGLFFLEKFTHNKGRTAGERRAKIPYLMNFLDDPRVEKLKQDEARDRL